MLSNDLSKKLMIRFKKSKDFNKTIEKLRKEGYNIELSCIKNKRYLKIMQDKHELLYMIYEDITDFIGEKGYEYLDYNKEKYKQNIIAIYY